MAATSSSVKVQLRFARERLSASSRDPQRDAALLLGRVLGKERAWLWTHPDVPLTEEEAEQFQELLARRAQHEPMQYILGEQEFYGLRFAVTPDVLIPRPETELLVETVLRWAPKDRSVRIVDVGTGSGAIAVALAQHLPLAEITAVDVSVPALAMARANAETHALAPRIRFLESDLLAAVAGEQFDAVVANPPYVSTAEELEQQVGQYEPALALFAGASGLEIYQRLVPETAAVVRPEGLMALEIGQGQQTALTALLAASQGWSEPVFLADLRGIARVARAFRQG